MKKICFTIPENSYQNGIVRVVVPLAIFLSNTNMYDISILSLSDTNMDKLPLKKNIKYIQLKVNKKSNRISRIYNMTKCLLKLFSCYVPDVVVVSGTEYVLPISMAINSQNTRLIAWEHRNFFAGPKYRLEWIGKRYALKRWDNIVCITKRDAYQYTSFAYAKNKIRQIYNLSGIEIKRYEYNYKAKKIISCGYLSHIKGFDMLINVAKNVFEKHDDWSWDIYGEGDERINLEHLIKQYGLSGNVFLKGYQENIKDLYNDYAFFVLTSRAEGMGMVIVEALRAGLPVVSFDILCGPSDVIKDGENGFLIKPFNLNDMSDKINCLIENLQLRKRFSLHSEKYLKDFSKDIILEKWIMLLNENKEEA